MSLNFPGHAAPAVGFEVPLEMLSACHGRIDQQCATLRALVPHVAAHGADRPAREAAAAVLRYFDSAAPHHHADEEEDLFPALLESMAGSDAVCLRELIAGLLAEHRALEVAWRPVRVALESIVAGSAEARLAGVEVEVLASLYERHIAREEGELLPMAKRLLDDATLDRIGRAMRARRGVAVEP
jgi:hemerythrin-like domain-containing protein